MAVKSKQDISLADAKAHFAELVRLVEGGRSIVLTRHGRPVARLVPLKLHGPPDWNQSRDFGTTPSEIGEGHAEYETSAIDSLSDRRGRRAALQRLLEDEIWPKVPKKMTGKAPTKKEREEILGIHENDT